MKLTRVQNKPLTTKMLQWSGSCYCESVLSHYSVCWTWCTNVVHLIFSSPLIAHLNLQSANMKVKYTKCVVCNKLVSKLRKYSLDVKIPKTNTKVCDAIGESSPGDVICQKCLYGLQKTTLYATTVISQKGSSIH